MHNEDANYDETFWLFEGEEDDQDVLSVAVRTKENPFGTPRFAVCGAMAAVPTEKPRKVKTGMDEGYVSRKFVFDVEAGQTVGCDKLRQRDHQPRSFGGNASVRRAGRRAQRQGCGL